MVNTFPTSNGNARLLPHENTNVMADEIPFDGPKAFASMGQNVK